MTLVQIDLRRGRDRRPVPPAPVSAAVVPAAVVPAAIVPATEQRSVSRAFAPAVGLILLAPLTGTAVQSGSTLALLLVGLGVLGLTAALVRPGAEVDP